MDMKTYRDEHVDDAFVRELYQYLVDKFSEYMDGIPPTKAVLGLSGGIDSALCAAIVCDAIGPENVIGAFLPSQFNTPKNDEADVAKLVKNLGITTFGTEDVMFLTDTVRDTVDRITEDWSGSAAFLKRTADFKSSVTMQNVQARIRMVILMTLANDSNAILINTCNLTEDLVGYATLWGDGAGMIAPLGSLGKMLVFELSKILDKIPEAIVNKAPSAGLFNGQTDEDDLPAPYSVLDPLTRALLPSMSMCGAGTALSKAGQEFDPALIREVLELMENNRFKWPLNPPAISIEPFLLARGIHEHVVPLERP